MTLEWDADSVSAAFSSRRRGTSTIAADPIESAGFTLSDFASGAMRLDHVVVNGVRIGVTAGRTIDYDSNRMVSLAFLDTNHSQLGTDISILRGDTEANRVDVRAKVAPVPYHRGQFRNETLIPGLVQRQGGRSDSSKSGEAPAAPKWAGSA